MEHFLPALQAVLDEVRAGLRLMTAPDDTMRQWFRQDDLVVFDPHDLDFDKGVVVVDLGAGPIIVRAEAAGDGFMRLSRGEEDQPVLCTQRAFGEAALGRVVAAVVRVPGAPTPSLE